MNIKIYFLLFIIYSFLGWTIEVIDVLFETKKIVNRGFMVGPVCPIYGVGCFLLVLFLEKYKSSPLALFILGIVICSILEYLTSYLLEKIFKIRWWDYSNKKYNINGRICLETMIPFGLIGCLLVYFIHPFLMSLISNIPTLMINILFYILLIIFLIDLIVSCKVITNIKIITTDVFKDSTVLVHDKVKNVILEKFIKFKNGIDSQEKRIRKELQEKNYFTKRFINSFPKFKVMERIKKRVKEKR